MTCLPCTRVDRERKRERERERENARTITSGRWLTRRVSREQAPNDATRRDAPRNRDGRDNRRDEASRRHTLCSATRHVGQPLACNYRTNKGQGSPTPRITRGWTCPPASSSRPLLETLEPSGLDSTMKIFSFDAFNCIVSPATVKTRLQTDG